MRNCYRITYVNGKDEYVSCTSLNQARRYAARREHEVAGIAEVPTAMYLDDSGRPVQDVEPSGELS